MKELLLVEDVKSVMNMLVDNVEKSFVLISEKLGGWHHYLGAGKASPLGTALGLAVLSYKTKRLDRKVLLGINLLETNINQDNGFGVKIVAGGDVSLTESTSFVCLSLITLVNKVELTKECKDKVADLIKRCVRWLIDNRNPAEGWSSRKGYQSRVFSTSIAVITLQSALNAGIINETSEPQLNTVLEAIKNAVNWLIDANNEDRGWGELPKNQKSTAFHTSISIIALKPTIMIHENEILKKAKKWLLTNWSGTYLWEKAGDATNLTEIYDISLDYYNWSRAIWNHFPTAWTIVALNVLGEDFKRLEMFKGIKWLLKQSKKGCIMRPTDPTPPIWAIWDALLCFDTFIT